MRILLPPSEGKTPASPDRAPSRLESRVYPHLADQRLAVGDALQAASRRPDALTILGVGQRVAADVERNRTLWQQPAAPAHDIYTGVLYAGAQLGSGRARHLAWADKHILIASGLWGWVRPGDCIPAYRCPMNVTLPGVGPLGPYWRRALKNAFTRQMEGELVVDCRSGAYQKAWMPNARVCQEHAIDLVQVKVVRLTSGREKVVSHNAKQWRGLLTQALVRAGGDGLTINDPGDLVEAQPQLFATIRDSLGGEHLSGARLEGGDGRWTLTLVTA